MKLNELMYLVGLASLFILIPVLAATSATSFFYGKEPWSHKQYKVMGSLFATVALLFALMLISAATTANNVNHLLGLFVVLFFAFFSHRNFRKAYPRLKK